MKKRILSFLLAICMLITIMPLSVANASLAIVEDESAENVQFEKAGKSEIVDSGTCGDNQTWTLYADGFLTINGTGRMTDFWEKAPWYGEFITSVVIDNGITNIGSNAFLECFNLSTISIPNTVRSIGVEAFGKCSALTNIAIPDSVTNIEEWAFADCYNLTSISIPNGVTEIQWGTFQDCYSLISLTLPNSTTQIARAAFYGCVQLDSIIIPSGVTTIGESAFCGCSSMTHIKIPNSVTKIGEFAFYGCTNLNNINIPNGVKEIESSTFYGCSNLTNIVIPDSVDIIGSAAFHGCTSLVSVTMPNSVTTIKDWTFYECKDLTSVTIPNSVTAIGRGAFIRCTNLADIYYSGDKEQWKEINIDNSNNSNAPLFNAIIHYNSTGPDKPITSGGEFKISANTATTCLKAGTTFEMNVGYYRNGAIDRSAQRFAAVSSSSNVVDFTTGDWNDETGRQYRVKAKQAGSCSITFTNPADGAAAKIDFTVIDGETGYTFDGVPKMTIEEGKTTNFYNFSGLVVDGFAYAPHKDAAGNIDYYNVTMTVYNTKNLYGTVASYSEDGEIYAVSVIDKHSDYSTSFVGDLKELTNSVGDLFFLLKNEQYYSGKSISTETPVSIRVPAGGYLQISNSLSSETAVFANIIGLLVDGTLRTKGLIDSSDKLLDVSGDIVDMVLRDNMKKLSMVLTDNFVEKQVSKELKNAAQKSFKTGTWNLNNYGDFMQSFLDNLNELGVDVADSISKTLNEGWGVLSVTESVVKKVIPTGHLINFLYSTLGMGDEILFWLNFQASANFPSGVFIYAPVSGNSYLSNGVSVTPTGPKDSNVVVHACLVVDTEGGSGNKRETYSINMYRSGEKVQPETTIMVRIPLSEQFEGIEKSLIKVYRQNDDGSITDMNATILDGYAVFKTDHLSYYSIVAESGWVNPFSDVKDNAWYAEAVQYVYENGLMAGVSSTTFSPNSTTTRGQLVTILYRAEGAPRVEETDKYSDVPTGKWYSKAVSWASANKIVSGYGNGRFGPNDGVTREQMVTILRRYAESRQIDTNKRVDLSNYTDYKSISTYAVTPMQWAVAEGLISGTSKTTLSPKATSARAQIATVLRRYQEKFSGSVE